jgi:hypothetical protein
VKTGPTPAITNQADDPKAQQYYRKNRPQGDSRRAIAHQARGDPARMSFQWVTELSA